jgi:hypothetical protein
MQDRLNFFEPWERPASHENQLTRALLVLFRYCPIVQQAWLSLVDAAALQPLDPKATKLTLHSLPRPTFDTQRAQILRSQDERLKTNEAIKGISVLCSAGASNVSPTAVAESNRGQVLDGIIRYGDDLVIVIESKLHEAADDRQARDINLHGQPIQFDGAVKKISWRDVLACFTDLADEKRSLTSGAEREILNDFLSFVDTNFPQLGPFSTLARCAAEPSRIRRRLHAILSEVLGADAIIPGTHTAVITAYIEYEDRQVKLRMYPADTLQQARVFYERPSVIEQTLMLQQDGWAKGFDWTTCTLPLAEYLRYWQNNIGRTAQVEREKWNEYWEELVRAKIAEPADREPFDHDFTHTDRHFASPRPGIQCTFAWQLDEAERLDARGRLVKAVKERINQLLDAIGEDKIGLE